MSESGNERAEAFAHLASRVQDMRALLACDDPYDEGPEDIGNVYEYGLSWEKVTTDHRHDTTTWAHVLSTGGPHEEFAVEFDFNGELVAVMFVYLPWFGREEIAGVDMDQDDAATVEEFYATFFGDLVAEDQS